MPPCRRPPRRRDGLGLLVFQLKRSYAGFSRECEIDDYHTVRQLFSRMQCSLAGEVPGRLPAGLHYEFWFRRQLLIPSGVPVHRIMRGGETFYAKVFDEDGYEYHWNCIGNRIADWTRKHARNLTPRVVRYDTENGKPYWTFDVDSDEEEEG